ncbi:MAG: TraR/DksA family transcriptional regulator [Deltaproteobacteria bacterium]|nr:TraR/DksA family transcriptional regulator [Deltaproteobacteria bacterium]
MQPNPTLIDSERREMLKATLLQLREHTCQRIRDFRREQSQESELGPGDSIDVARSSADIETHAGLIARAEEKLKYLDEAISQLEAGTYGTCAGCHESIPIERLIALPFAPYCLSCQRRRRPSQDTWSGRGTIAPYDHLWTPPDEMKGVPGPEFSGTSPDQTVNLHDRVRHAIAEPPAATPSSRTSKGARKHGIR